MRTLLIAVLLVTGMAGCAEEKSPTESDETPVEDDFNMTAPPMVAAPMPVTVEVQLSGAYPANIAYSPARIEVPAGSNVTIKFTNNDVNPLVNHDWVLEGIDGASTAMAANGETVEITFIAPEVGEYAFFCSVGNHRDVGMEGVFVVTA